MNGEKVIPVKVALRTRPLIQREIEEGASECLVFIKDAQQVIVNGNKAFTYDYVFDSKDTQEHVYKISVSPLIDGIFKGYNGTVLAYGQTGSGKTYSMGSAHCVSEVDATDTSTGIIPRVIRDLFEGISRRTAYQFLIKVSYVEIYMEEVKDLLAPEGRKQDNLQIRENSDGSIRIAGLTEVVVSNPHETLDFMEKGNCARSTGSTAMNATSSRSHAIFTVSMESRGIDDPDDYKRSKFHLVDLAGSERVHRTKAQGERLQEGIKINSGLLALGNVISALGEERSRDQHIPYRVSKLTRILQDSLGGNSLTVMIACVSPADSNCSETVNTMRYADRARKIKNKAVVNRDPKAAELLSLRQEIQQLRLRLLQNGSSTTCTEVVRDSPRTKERIAQLESENKELVSEMHKLVDSNTEMCEKAIATDLVREQLQGKLKELKTQAEKVADDTHDLSLVEEAVSETAQRECVQNLRLLRSNVLAVKFDVEASTPAEIAASMTSLMADESKEGDSTMTEENEEEASVKAEHILRTAKMSNQLQELTKALAMKEELARRMCAGEENMDTLKVQYEEKLAKLDMEITDLQKEKDGLVLALNVAKHNNENHAISEKRRLRLLELENQIKELKREKKEKEKMARLKREGDHKITKLNSEIQAIKNSRVKLMRQIKEESTKYQTLKKEKEREVKQLKEKDRKRQYEIVKLERDFMKQKNVLRRKTEEAAASNRRWKELLDKQKVAAAKRMQSHSKVLDSANTKMRLWIEEDIEIAVRTKEAKKHLEELEEDVKVLRSQLQTMDESASPNKRRKTYVKSDMDDMDRRRAMIEDELELKETLIKDLQSKSGEAKEVRCRQQARWMQITSIAEARAVMKHLFGLVVAARFSEEENAASSNRAREEKKNATERIETLEADLEKARREMDHEITFLEASHHEQVLFLTSQLNRSSAGQPTTSISEREADLASQIKIQANVIQEMLKKQDEYQNLLDESRRSSEDLAKTTLFKSIDESGQTKPKKKSSVGKNKKRPEKDNRITEKEFFDALSGDDSYIISDHESEPEYIPTPIRRRTTKESRCSCKMKCKNGRCKCVKLGSVCSDRCGCVKENCANRSPKDCSPESDDTPEPEEIVATPYYSRMPLFDADVNSPVSSPRKGAKDAASANSSVEYQPCYFASPVVDATANDSRASKRGASTKSKNKRPSSPLPSKKSAVVKKRKLQAEDNLLMT